jgi:wobble nucleotide-excising tRNase
MLRRVIAIKNVGRFRNSAATPNPALAKHTFIFAGNGFGKTTLCTVMRSVQSGDAAPVHGRRTLGATTAPEIDLLFADGTRRLQNGSWSATAPKISIFDGVFVAANVHSGAVVDVAHRRNLYRVIVGAEGVGLAEQEQALAEEARAKQAELTAAERAVQALVPSGIALGNFLDLPADPGIDAKIDAQRQTLNALKQAETIRTRAALADLPCRPFLQTSKRHWPSQSTVWPPTPRHGSRPMYSTMGCGAMASDGLARGWLLLQMIPAPIVGATVCPGSI